MKLSENSLKKLIKGACYFEENGGYLTPFRFCKRQLDMTKREGYNEAWRNRVLFSGGIRLELKTNARNISFFYKAYFGDCQVGGRSKSIDTWVDGHTLTPRVDECYCDGIHPNEYGCLLIAQSLYKIIKDVRF